MLRRLNILDIHRKRHSSDSSSESDIEAPKAAMDALLHSFTGSKATPTKPVAAVHVAVDHVDHSDSDSETRSNGESSSTSGADTTTTTAVTKSSVVSSKSKPVLRYFSRPKEISKKITGLVCKLPAWEPLHVEKTTLKTFLEYIAEERLIHMPRRGSDWDRVLRLAHLFACQLQSFADHIECFAPGSIGSTTAALASCRALLEVGHNSAKALLPTFAAFYELTMLFSTIGQATQFEELPNSVLEDGANILCDTVDLVALVAIKYRQIIATLKKGADVRLDFDNAFGKDLGNIWKAKQAFSDRVWSFALRHDGNLARLHSLQTKLGSNVLVSAKTTHYDEVAEHLERSEDTCTWFRDSLSYFLSNKKQQSLVVSGPAGSGKTVLAEWVEERLALPLDNKHYSVLKYNFPFDSPRGATALACVKSLLIELLDRSIGNVELYHQLDTAFKQHDVKSLEASLWSALQAGLRHAAGQHKIVIVIDGCDTIVGGEKEAVRFHQSLLACVKNLPKTKVISFMRPVKELGTGSRMMTISKDELTEDIRCHLKQILAPCEGFKQLDLTAKWNLVDTVAAQSEISFTRAFHAGRLLSREQSAQSLEKAAKNMSNQTKDVLQKALDTLNVKKNDLLRRLLSFMAVTEEPFEIQQVAQLMSVDLDKKSIATQTFNPFRYITDHCSDLVVIRGGRVHFRTASVRSLMVGQLGHSLLPTKVAHYELTMRLLLYARLVLGSCSQEVSVEGLSHREVLTTFASYHLLKYVMRNWVLHFKQSGCWSQGHELSLPKDMAAIFPNSVMFGLLERSCWADLHDKSERLSWHDLSFSVSKKCFGEQHILVLQQMICLSHVHHSISVTSTEHYDYLYQAIKLGRNILSEHSAVLFACVSLFLTYTETIVVTKRTTTITHREEMIRYMISICKHKHGETSDEVISWYEKLAKLYIDIKEETTATVIYRELYEIIVIRHGKKSREAIKFGSFFGTLDVILEGEEGEKQIKQLEGFIFETGEKFEVTDQLSFTMLIRLAQSYFSCGKIFLAERLFVSLWSRLSVLCRRKVSHETHILRLQVAIEYVKFLRRVKRIEEAKNILICLWAEYEHYHCEHESLLIWIREVGTLCKTFSLLTIAVSIFTKVWGWFKGKGQGDNAEAQKTTTLITEVVEEITETTTVTKTTTTTKTEVIETVTKEIFELHFERCRKTKADKAFFSACMALIGFYLKEERWSEAEIVIKRTLEITWKAILSTEVNITICESSVTECILVARRLAVCYLSQGMFELAEKIYLRIYHACLASLSLESLVLQENMMVLVEFYDKHHCHEKVVEIYVALLARYRKHLEPTHPLTIKLMYLIAAQYEMTGRQEAYTYYLEILSVLNKGHHHCHHDAFKAAVVLIRHYHSRKMWVELQKICTAAWETIVHHRGELTMTEEIITLIYQKYSFVLHMHAKVNFSILYKLTVEYKEVITVLYTEHSHAYLVALIALAQICETSEEHYHESVTLYEEVIKRSKTLKTTTTTVTETTTITVKRRLSKMYVTFITSGKGGSTTTTTTTTIDRAIEVSLEAFAQLKIEFGCWHEKTLLKLKDICILYQALKTTEARLKMIQLIQVTVIEIITSKTTTTMGLFAAAGTLAALYISLSLVAEAKELLRQLRHLAIFHNSHTGGQITLKIDQSLSKTVFVFIMAFEQGLSTKKDVISYSEFMSEMILESLLYEEYCRVIKKETKIEIILGCGARLRGFWDERKRTHLLGTLDDKLLQLFLKEYGTCWKGLEEEHVRVFYLAVLTALSVDRGETDTNFVALSCHAGVAKVKALIKAGEFKQAVHLAHVVYEFGKKHDFFFRPGYMHYAYQLAELLCGIDAPVSSNESVRKSCFKLSQEITTEVLANLRAADVDLLGLKPKDLAGLICLLGVQENYAEAESLLSLLWQARHAMQRSFGWSTKMVLEVGKALVHAQYANGHRVEAVDTAEVLYYNLRRGRGKLEADTLEVGNILSTLYTESSRFDKAMGVHKGVLQEMGFVCNHDGAVQPNEKQRARFVSCGNAHLAGLRDVQKKMKGWKADEEDEYRQIVEDVISGLKLDLAGFDQWYDQGLRTAVPVCKMPATNWKIL